MYSSKKFLSLILFLMVFPLFSVVAQTPEENDEAGIDSSRVWDFGEVKEGVILEHVFKLRNDSTQVLNITNASTSCGCTVSEIAKKTLAPDEETEIKVKFNTKGYKGKTKQFVFVMTESLNNPVIQFMIKADVQKP